MSEMIERVAAAMKERASNPVENLNSLEGVLVGSLGDAWSYLARAAIEAMREPTDEMLIAGENLASDIATADDRIEVPASIEITWPAMIDSALKD